MNIKTILILTMILLSVSLCGCLETTTTSETMKVVAYYPIEEKLLCINQYGEYEIFDMDHLMTQTDVNEIGEEMLPYYPDIIYESNRNEAYIIAHKKNLGILGTNKYEQITAYINSSVIDSKQV